MKTELLRLKDICSGDILHNFDLHILEGEVVALAGLSDSNSTAVANILTEEERFDSGYLWLYEREIRSHVLKKPHHYGIFRIYNSPTLIPTLTIAENIFLTRPEGINYGVPSKKERQFRTSIIFEELNIMLSPSVYVKDLAPLQALQIEIICRIINGAHLIVMEDVWGAFSPSELELLFSFIKSASSIGIAFMIITNRPEIMTAMLDRIVVMHRGQMLRTFYGSEYTPGTMMRLVHPSENDVICPSVSTGQLDIPVFTADGICCQTLHDFSFSVHNSKIVGVLDYKEIIADLLFQILIGEQPYSGSLTFHGKPFVPHSRESLSAAGIGLSSFRDPTLFDNLTWVENLAVYYGLYHQKAFHIRRNIISGFLDQYSDILDNLNPEKPLKSLVIDEYTRAKLRYLCWVVAQPDVLFLIAPMTNGDSRMREIICSMIHRIASAGTGILLISSNPNEIDFCCQMKVESSPFL